MRDGTALGQDWRKSSYSGGGNNCVEVARPAAGVVAVRDTTHRQGTPLVVGPEQWRRFAAAVKAGRFDRA
jgi:hypothetical protein